MKTLYLSQEFGEREESRTLYFLTRRLKKKKKIFIVFQVQTWTKKSGPETMSHWKPLSLSKKSTVSHVSWRTWPLATLLLITCPPLASDVLGGLPSPTPADFSLSHALLPRLSCYGSLLLYHALPSQALSPHNFQGGPITALLKGVSPGGFSLFWHPPR